jgi:hypothetical protein
MAVAFVQLGLCRTSQYLVLFSWQKLFATLILILIRLGFRRESR